MKTKLVLAFCLLGATLASAKSYQITVAEPSNVGDVQLKAGDYTVSIAGTKVTFTEVNSGKATETTGVVGSAPKKFAATAVDTATINGTNQIQEIDLGGTTTKIEFNK